MTEFYHCFFTVEFDWLWRIVGIHWSWYQRLNFGYRDIPDFYWFYFSLPWFKPPKSIRNAGCWSPSSCLLHCGQNQDRQRPQHTGSTGSTELLLTPSTVGPDCERPETIPGFYWVLLDDPSDWESAAPSLIHSYCSDSPWWLTALVYTGSTGHMSQAIWVIDYQIKWSGLQDQIKTLWRKTISETRMRQTDRTNKNKNTH